MATIKIQKGVQECNTADDVLIWLENWKDKIRKESYGGNLREAYVLQQETTKALKSFNLESIDATQDDQEIIDFVLNDIKAIPSKPTSYR